MITGIGQARLARGCCTAVLTVATVIPTLGGDVEARAGAALLENARRELGEGDNKFIAAYRIDVLLARLAILECQTDPEKALRRARAIRSPFYSSLALGGIAATEVRSGQAESMQHFREALVRAKEITHGAGEHPTSLAFLYQLIPAYPKQDAVDLLALAEKTLGEWQNPDRDGTKALLAFCRASTTVTPEKAESLLLNVALKSNHNWASTEHLATFLARQSMGRALALSEAHYQAKTNWPNCETFRNAVLMELAKTDFPKAFAEVKKLREVDREIGAIKLARVMLDEGRKPEAREVIADVQALGSKIPGTRSRLVGLQQRLAQDGTDANPDAPVRPEGIDDFLETPNEERLRALANAGHVTFRDEKQIREFVSKSLPLARDSDPLIHSHHGDQRSTNLGFVLICCALAGDTGQALETSKAIGFPGLRVEYLLAAYDHLYPVPAVVSEWPLHTWRRTCVYFQPKEAVNTP